MLKERRTPLIALLRDRTGDALDVVEPGRRNRMGAVVAAGQYGSGFPAPAQAANRGGAGRVVQPAGLHGQNLRLSALGHGERDLASVVGLLGDALRLAPAD